MPLLANVRTGLADVGHDPLSILGNLVKVSRSDGSGIEERGDKSDRGSAVREVLPSVVKVDAGGGVDGKEGKCWLLTGALCASWGPVVYPAPRCRVRCGALLSIAYNK